MVRLAPQTPHCTATEEERAADQRANPSLVRVYPHTHSHVRAGFVRVWNQGTPEFDGGVLAKKVLELPFDAFLDKVVNGEWNIQEDKRGNYQRNFGFSSGQNFKARTADMSFKYLGVSIPQLLVETKEHLALMRLCTELMQLMGVSWEDPAFWNSTKGQWMKEILLNELDSSGKTRVGLVTVAFVPLDEKAGVNEHVDAQNPLFPMSQVGLFQKVCIDRNEK